MPLDSRSLRHVYIVAVKRNPDQRTLNLKRDKALPNVRVTAEEKARFEKLAEVHHLSLGTLIRQLLHFEADKLEKGKAA
jgi:hypothetical protein